MRWILISLFLLGCSPKGEVPQAPAFIGSEVSGMRVDTATVLAGHDGKSYRLADFRGKVVVSFFGYTHCPDVCPTTMGDLGKAMKQLGPSAQGVQVLFVTLDPERDTVAVLNKYVPYFNSSFLGLRAEPEATQKLAQEFKVYYAQQASESKSGYLIDHSAGLYVFDRKGDLRLYMNYGQSAQNIAHDLALLLAEK